MAKDTLKPPVKTKVGTFQFRRLEKAEDFVCGHCGYPKGGRIRVDWDTTNGEKKVICNLCYGNLLLQNK